jgi:DNA polymerase I-like protein with 3'-5' exonuclease and polymerase domains
LLKIWTSAASPTVQKVFGPILKNYRPDVPPHHFIEFDESLPNPATLEVVLVCGNHCLNVLRLAGLVPKNKTVTSMRGVPIASPGGGTYLVTFDPGLTQTVFSTRELIEWDVRLAVRFLRTCSFEPSLGDYKWAADLQEVVDYVIHTHAGTHKPVDVSMDLETMGLYPWYPDKDILSISFTAKPRTAHLLYLGKQPGTPRIKAPSLGHIEFLLTSPMVKLRGSNLKFDLNWIFEKWGIACTNFKFDNLLVGTLLDENRSNSLNLHAKVYTDMGGYDDVFNKTTDKAHMEDVPTDKLLGYAGGDTDAAQQVADVLRDNLADDAALTRFYITILHPGARAFEKVERRGVCVDVEKSKELASELRVVIAEAQKTAMELLPQKMLTKFRDRIVDQIEDGKSPLLPSILKDYFFTTDGLNLKPREFTPKPDKNGAKVPSMAKSHLRQFADVPAAVAMVTALTTMDTAGKTLSTFVEGFLKHLRPDGRLHPTYMLFHGGLNDDEDDESGTTTGRLSAKEPAIQIMPKKTKWAKKIRACYPAPPGKVIVSIDYSQGELKIVACLAPEPTMLQSYLDGLDLHAVTGAKLSKTPLHEFLTWKDNEDKALADLFDKHRGNAKPANFGLIYGMSAGGFQAYSWANYGIRLSLAEATQMRDAFFELYPGLLEFHNDQKAIVNAHEAVRSPLGRIRHLPHIRSWDREIRAKAERQGINAPVQSTLTDMMVWAIALIDQAYPNGEIEVVAMIHDALIAYVPEDNFELWAGRAAQIMANLPLHEVGWKPQLQFTVDAEAGPNLASLKKLKLAA